MLTVSETSSAVTYSVLTGPDADAQTGSKPRNKLKYSLRIYLMVYVAYTRPSARRQQERLV